MRHETFVESLDRLSESLNKMLEGMPKQPPYCEACGEPDDFLIRCDVCHNWVCVDCIVPTVDKNDHLHEVCEKCTSQMAVDG